MLQHCMSRVGLLMATTIGLVLIGDSKIQAQAYPPQPIQFYFIPAYYYQPTLRRLPPKPSIPLLNNGSLQTSPNPNAGLPNQVPFASIAAMPLGDRLGNNGIRYDQDLIPNLGYFLGAGPGPAPGPMPGPAPGPGPGPGPAPVPGPGPPPMPPVVAARMARQRMTMAMYAHHYQQAYQQTLMQAYYSQSAAGYDPYQSYSTSLSTMTNAGVGGTGSYTFTGGGNLGFGAGFQMPSGSIRR